MGEREEVKINIGGRGEEKGKRMKREKRKGRGVKEESEEKKEGKGRGKGGGGDWRERGERRWRGERTEKLHWRNLALRVHYVKDTKFIVALW